MSLLRQHLPNSLLRKRAMATRAFVPFHGSMDNYAAVAGLGKAMKAESPSAERNKQPILETLTKHIPQGASGLSILELASGSGQHVAHFAQHYLGITFQPSDCTTELFGSIHAYAEGLPNIRLPPLLIDARQPVWPGVVAGQLDAIITINMTHISPWSATLGLLAGAGKYLADGGKLFLYGPFKRNQQHTSESNAQFDASLQARNPEWGYRDIDDITKAAAVQGLQLLQIHEMPANNFMLVFSKQQPTL